MAESMCYRIQEKITHAKDWTVLEQCMKDIQSSFEFGLLSQRQGESLGLLCAEMSKLLPEGEYKHEVESVKD